MNQLKVKRNFYYYWACNIKVYKFENFIFEPTKWDSKTKNRLTIVCSDNELKMVFKTKYRNKFKQNRIYSEYNREKTRNVQYYYWFFCTSKFYLWRLCSEIWIYALLKLFMWLCFCFEISSTTLRYCQGSEKKTKFWKRSARVSFYGFSGSKWFFFQSEPSISILP